MSLNQENVVPADQLYQAPPIEIAGKVVQPVVRVQRWQLLGGAGYAAWIRLSPHAVQVQADGKTYTLPIVDPSQAQVQRFLRWGVAISALCWCIMLFSRLAHWGKSVG